MYQVKLPEEAERIFNFFQISISFGFSEVGVPLQCAGFHGYLAKLVFWMVVPLVLLLAVPLVHISVALWRSRHATMGDDPHVYVAFDGKELTAKSLPTCLKLIFLCYPAVSTVAFSAFDCVDFGADGKYLRADFQIPCNDGDEYQRVKAVAVLAISIFSIGVPVGYAVLLFGSRHAIRRERPTPITQALGFLHQDYHKHFYAWEVRASILHFAPALSKRCNVAPMSHISLAP